METNKEIREQILQVVKENARLVEKHIKALGFAIFVRVMSGEERSAFDMSMAKFADDKGNVKPSTAGMRAMIISLLPYTICDSNGVAIFTEDDIKKMYKQKGSNLILSELRNVALTVNGLSDVATKEIEGN